MSSAAPPSSFHQPAESRGATTTTNTTTQQQPLPLGPSSSVSVTFKDPDGGGGGGMMTPSLRARQLTSNDVLLDQMVKLTRIVLGCVAVFLAPLALTSFLLDNSRYTGQFIDLIMLFIHAGSALWLHWLIAKRRGPKFSERRKLWICLQVVWWLTIACLIIGGLLCITWLLLLCSPDEGFAQDANNGFLAGVDSLMDVFSQHSGGTAATLGLLFNGLCALLDGLGLWAETRSSKLLKRIHEEVTGGTCPLTCFKDLPVGNKRHRPARNSITDISDTVSIGTEAAALVTPSDINDDNTAVEGRMTSEARMTNKIRVVDDDDDLTLIAADAHKSERIEWQP